MARLIDADKLAAAILDEFGDVVKDDAVNHAIDVVYGMVINAPTVKVLYICDGKKCDECNSYCELTSDINHAETTDTVIFADGTANQIWEVTE